ncbi:methyltransferase FkbM domain containing protein [Nitzschia inconspicua]|uniref:Methyltransferase FkbM domain containing protein n=1 Tax=Nitzschia inconspicua TaxID=303405 RepID=A0A9K3PQJ5_9STRA|nr:methyltransferase FkbM domain containing protein [Nitzschia inconspicua]
MTNIHIHITSKQLILAMGCVIVIARMLHLSSTSPSLRTLSKESTTSNSAKISMSSDVENRSTLKTLGEIKRSMTLPCNYVHDGFFIPHSNEITNQVYQTLMELPDDTVPVFIEVGGHDGITKSMSLKVSRCLQVNTMLIEASPTNYRVLEKARSYDITVNAALCEGNYAEMEESADNSGQSKLQGSSGKSSSRAKTVRVPCTSIDTELDKLKATLPPQLKSKLKLVFLVLDVEGFEPVAIRGVNKYSPMKAYIEWTRVSDEDDDKMLKWAARHDLKGDFCGPLERDMCFNFHPTLFYEEFGDETDPSSRTGLLPWMKDVFYGARFENPAHTATTSKASKSYMFYGE